MAWPPQADDYSSAPVMGAFSVWVSPGELLNWPIGQ
jgi:hypothetical protein